MRQVSRDLASPSPVLGGLPSTILRQVSREFVGGAGNVLSKQSSMGNDRGGPSSGYLSRDLTSDLSAFTSVQPRARPVPRTDSIPETQDEGQEPRRQQPPRPSSSLSNYTPPRRRAASARVRPAQGRGPRPSPARGPRRLRAPLLPVQARVALGAWAAVRHGLVPHHLTPGGPSQEPQPQGVQESQGASTPRQRAPRQQRHQGHQPRRRQQGTRAAGGHHGRLSTEGMGEDEKSDRHGRGQGTVPAPSRRKDSVRVGDCIARLNVAVAAVCFIGQTSHARRTDVEVIHTLDRRCRLIEAGLLALPHPVHVLAKTSTHSVPTR